MIGRNAKNYKNRSFRKNIAIMKRIIQISTLALLVVLTTGCKKSYTVTVKSNNPEWGTVTGSGSYKDGETVIISAVPAQGCCFVSWKDGNTANPRQIVVLDFYTATNSY